MASQFRRSGQLASEFDVARVTARQAVRLLSADGVLTSHRRRGTFVTARVVTQASARCHDSRRIHRSTTSQLLTIDENSRIPPIHSTLGTLAPRYTYAKQLMPARASRTT
jgi:GntR family transcriptional regulator